MTTAPVLYWIRRDLRLADNPALVHALDLGAPVIPVFVCDDVVDGLGAAPKWRLEKGVENFATALDRLGARLILRRGRALDALRALVAQTGARAVIWSRAYDPDQIARDTVVKAGLKDDGIDAVSMAGHLLFEPWSVETKTGAFYKVYTPFFKSVRDRDIVPPLPAPATWPAPDTWPASDTLADWHLGAAMNRGGKVVARFARVGEDAARDRLAAFLDGPIHAYDSARDLPSVDGTSGLSENLALGEISPRVIWHAGAEAMRQGAKGAETFLKELVWREFAYHLVYHTPEITTRNWKSDWDTFPWRDDTDQARAWRQGRTGIRFVDAAMREMYVTGRMHNRGRMIVASYLTKHLMTHWKIGMDWFADCLIDWDPAANAMGWQWAAGSGPDAAPYFRVFNPDTQLEKFDKKGGYPRRFIAELYPKSPHADALAFFDAVPRAWGMSPDASYPAPIVDLATGRKRALDAYAARSNSG